MPSGLGKRIAPAHPASRLASPFPADASDDESKTAPKAAVASGSGAAAAAAPAPSIPRQNRFAGEDEEDEEVRAREVVWPYQREGGPLTPPPLLGAEQDDWDASDDDKSAAPKAPTAAPRKKGTLKQKLAEKAALVRRSGAGRAVRPI